MKTQSTTNQRLSFIDIAKSIALMLIVYSHTAHCYGQVYLGSFFIAAFFFMSGYTSKPIVSWKTYLTKRTKRLLIPYFIFNVIFVILCRNFSTYDLLGIVYSRYTIDIFGGTTPVMLRSLNAPLWFFTAMFFSDVLFVCINRLVNFTNKSLIVHGIVVSILLVLCYLLNQIPILLPWSIDTIPFFTLFMYIGLLSSKYNLLEFLHGWKMIFIIILLVLGCYINGSINLSIRSYGHSILLCFLTGLMGSFLLVWIGKLLENLSLGHILATTGKHTLTIFSLQMFVLHFINSAISFVRYDGGKTTINILLGAIAVVVVFIIGVIASKGLRRIMPSVF